LTPRSESYDGSEPLLGNNHALGTLNMDPPLYGSMDVWPTAQGSGMPLTNAIIMDHAKGRQVVEVVEGFRHASVLPCFCLVLDT
jgi:hypothetical protein